MLCLGRSSYFQFKQSEESKKIKNSKYNLPKYTTDERGNFNPSFEPQSPTSSSPNTSSNPRSPLLRTKVAPSQPVVAVGASVSGCDRQSFESRRYRDSLEGTDFADKLSRFESLVHGKRKPPKTATDRNHPLTKRGSPRVQRSLSPRPHSPRPAQTKRLSSSNDTSSLSVIGSCARVLDQSEDSDDYDDYILTSSQQYLNRSLQPPQGCSPFKANLTSPKQRHQYHHDYSSPLSPTIKVSSITLQHNQPLDSKPSGSRSPPPPLIPSPLKTPFGGRSPEDVIYDEVPCIVGHQQTNHNHHQQQQSSQQPPKNTTTAAATGSTQHPSRPRERGNFVTVTPSATHPGDKTISGTAGKPPYHNNHTYHHSTTNNYTTTNLNNTWSHHNSNNTSRQDQGKRAGLCVSDVDLPPPIPKSVPPPVPAKPAHLRPNPVTDKRPATAKDIIDYKGEKIFTKGTAVTRVSLKELDQRGKPQRKKPHGTTTKDNTTTQGIGGGGEDKEKSTDNSASNSTSNSTSNSSLRSNLNSNNNGTVEITAAEDEEKRGEINQELSGSGSSSNSSSTQSGIGCRVTVLNNSSGSGSCSSTKQSSSKPDKLVDQQSTDDRTPLVKDTVKALEKSRPQKGEGSRNTDRNLYKPLTDRLLQDVIKNSSTAHQQRSGGREKSVRFNPGYLGDYDDPWEFQEQNKSGTVRRAGKLESTNQITGVKDNDNQTADINTSKMSTTPTSPSTGVSALSKAAPATSEDVSTSPSGGVTQSYVSASKLFPPSSNRTEYSNNNNNHQQQQQHHSFKTPTTSSHSPMGVSNGGMVGGAYHYESVTNDDSVQPVNRYETGNGTYISSPYGVHSASKSPSGKMTPESKTITSVSSNTFNFLADSGLEKELQELEEAFVLARSGPSTSSSCSNDTLGSTSNGNGTDHGAPPDALHSSSLCDAASPGLRESTSAQKKEPKTDAESSEPITPPVFFSNDDDSLSLASEDSLDLTGSQQDLRILHRRMVEERKKEQEAASKEKQRLDEILNICADYQRGMEEEMHRQHQTSASPQDVVPTTGVVRSESRNSMSKIKTNGSLTKLSSPSLLHKDLSGPTFDYSGRRRSSNCSDGSLEDLLSTGSSRTGTDSNNGTIKRQFLPSNSPASPVFGGTPLRPHSSAPTSSPHRAQYNSPTSPDITPSSSSGLGSASGLHISPSHSSGSKVSSPGPSPSANKYGTWHSSSVSSPSYTATSISRSNVNPVSPLPTTAQSTPPFPLVAQFPLVLDPVLSPTGGPRSPRCADLEGGRQATSHHQPRMVNGIVMPMPDSSPVLDGGRRNVLDAGHVTYGSSGAGEDLTPSSSGVETSSEQSLSCSEDSDPKSQYDRYRINHTDCIRRITRLKQQILDVETQQAEMLREIDMERALLEGEQKNEVSELHADSARIQQLRNKEHTKATIEHKQMEQQRRMAEEKRKLEELEKQYDVTKQTVATASGQSVDKLQGQLTAIHEQLEQQRRMYEEMEFQHLEVEAHYEEEKEILERDLTVEKEELIAKYQSRQIILQQIDRQQQHMTAQVKQDMRVYEKQREHYLQQFKQERVKLERLEEKMKELSQTLNLPTDFININAEQLSTLLDTPVPGGLDIREYLQQCTPDNSPAVHRKIEEEGMVNAADESYITDQRVHWQDGYPEYDNHAHAAHYSPHQTRPQSVENSSLGSSDRNSEDKETSISSGEEHLEKLLEMERLLLEAGGGDQLGLLGEVREQEAELLALKVERQKRKRLEKQLHNETLRRDELVKKEIRLREQQRLQTRPLTCYLPISNRTLDLKAHIEAAGHHLDMCKEVILDSSSCRGALLKMGSRFKLWQRRWFVFDRHRKSLMYYLTKEAAQAAIKPSTTSPQSPKPKGGFYFQSIQEVYVDHLKQVKSPSPTLTFCVKTLDRTYYLVAPTPEAMRIWIDVIFTGAEGYQQYG